jgi:hypothetical protein
MSLARENDPPVLRGSHTSKFTEKKKRNNATLWMVFIYFSFPLGMLQLKKSQLPQD